ncbi:MAG: tail fiber protein [Bacteroidia bacterium]|jgi:microcystin-dependent protein|nr:tail fiber protein [Bacteroidia bacterium]
MEGTIGEIRYFAANFSPKSWAYCSGQTMQISSNTALFSILGTTYGGNGQSTFMLPNAAGRATIGVGQGPGLTNYNLGQTVGVESVVLNTNNLPPHIHTAPIPNAMLAVNNTAGTISTPTAGSSIAVAGNTQAFNQSTPNTVLNNATGTITSLAVNCGITGSNQPHNNMMPYTVLSQIICVQGYFPPRN